MFVIVDDRHKVPSYFWKGSIYSPLITLSLEAATIYKVRKEAEKVVSEFPPDTQFQFRVAELIPKPL